MAIPTHVAFIMDGNGRWAEARGLPRSEGHRQGALTAKNIAKIAKTIGIKYITLFAFSTENFFRQPKEVAFLIELFEKFLKANRSAILKQQIRFRTIGDLSKFPLALQNTIATLEQNSAAFDAFHLTLALNYGAKDEIVRAVKKILNDNSITAQNVSWEIVEKYLDTSGIPEPDMVIRTSGEERLSNFLLLQAAYAELYFTKTFWPDFDESEFRLAIDNFQNRKRKMGK